MLAACTKKESGSVDTSSPEQVLIQKGKSVYQAVCIACHNMNPKLDGSLGPAVAGSSIQLLNERIVNGGYPAGYQPKRATKLMAPLPQYAQDIPAIHAYLNALP